ncbi:MAG: hypothetical protein GY776_17530 [Alteromonas sp.]|nr:hypothetical protein [Alteromonas sp.]
MTKQIRRNAPAGAEYYSIQNGKAYYYATDEREVFVMIHESGRWQFIEWMDAEELDGDGFHKIRRSTWKEWVWSIVFVLGFVTVLGVVYG